MTLYNKGYCHVTSCGRRARPPALEGYRRPLVSPFCRRVLLVVAAAMRFAAAVLRPCFFADALIFSYCRVRFALFTPRGGMVQFLLVSGQQDPCCLTRSHTFPPPLAGRNLRWR
jgi:hypothetical protein